MGASFANPEGHYEDLPLVQVHDDILAANGTSWQEANQYSLNVPSFLENKLRTYISQRIENKDTLLGAKDPRALLFIDAWLAIKQIELKSIFVFRDWRYSVSSILKRHSRELLQTSSAMATRPNDIIFWQYPELAAKMWITSAKAMLNWLEHAPKNTLIFPLSSFINQEPRLFTQAIDKGIPSALLMSGSTVRKELLHSKIPSSINEMLPQELQNHCDKILNQLYEASGFKNTEQVSYHNVPTELIYDHFTQATHNHSSSNFIPPVVTPINLSRFTISEVIQLLENNKEYCKQKVDWDALFKRKDITANNYDKLFYYAQLGGHTAHAEIAIRRALTLQPASWRWMHLGDLLFKQGLIDDAEQCYKQAQKRTPENATFVARLAEIEIARNNLSNAESLIQEAKQLDPSKPAITTAENKLLLQKSKLKQASSGASTNSDNNIMPVISDYSNIVAEMTENQDSGKKLDEYMVKAAFTLRDNKAWLQDGVSCLSLPSKNNLLDYLTLHAKKYWPDEVLKTEFLQNNDVAQKPIKPLRIIKRTDMPSIGIHIHVYYPHLLPEIYRFLDVLPHISKCVITCPHEVTESTNQLLAKQPFTEVIAVENKGRDIAPWLIHAAPRLSHCDLVLKLHTKATPHATKLKGWRLQLLWSLISSEDTIQSLLVKLKNSKDTGVVMPAYHPNIYSHINWGKNKDIALQLAQELALTLSPDFLPFPAGSMFWYKPKALAALTNKPWDLSDFPEEKGQIDGTVMHAIERLIPYVVQQSGYSLMFVNPLQTFN